MGVLLLTLSVITPASSVFIIAPGMLQVAGTGAVWAMVVAAIVCLATALIYAELSSLWPVAGGEYVFVAKTLGPLAGFVMLGVNVFSNLLFAPVAALGLSAVLARVAPGLPDGPLAIGVVLACMAVAVLDIRVNAWVTGLFLALELAALLVVTWLGVAHWHNGLLPMLTAPVMPTGSAMVPATAASIGVAASIAIFAFNGYGMAVYFAEEMHEPRRHIAGTILSATWMTVLAIGVPVIAALAAAGDLPALTSAEDPFGQFIADFASPGVASAVALGVAIAIVNAIIAAILACARFFYGSARDRCWGAPVDGWLGAIHPRFGTPWLGTLIVGGLMALACLLPLTLLLAINGMGLVVIYGGIALAAMVARRSGAADDAPYRMKLFPLAPLITLAAVAYIVATSWFDLEEGRPALIAAGAEILLSAGYYWLVLRRRGAWTVTI